MQSLTFYPNMPYVKYPKQNLYHKFASAHETRTHTRTSVSYTVFGPRSVHSKLYLHHKVPCETRGQYPLRGDSQYSNSRTNIQHPNMDPKVLNRTTSMQIAHTPLFESVRNEAIHNIQIQPSKAGFNDKSAVWAREGETTAKDVLPVEHRHRHKNHCT